MKNQRIIFLFAFLLASFGAFCEISFVRATVLIFQDSDSTSYDMSILYYAIMAPLVYIFYWFFGYISSVYNSYSMLPDVLKKEISHVNDSDNKEHIYKTLSDDHLMVVENVYFTTYLMFYRIIVLIALFFNLIITFFANSLLNVILILLVASLILSLFKKLMSYIAAKFSKAQNKRHEIIAIIIKLIGNNKSYDESLFIFLIKIFPYKVVITSMGSLMKPLIDFLTIAFVIFIALGFFGDTNSSNSFIAGIGATGWRALGPAINVVLAFGHISYGFSSLNKSWKEVIKRNLGLYFFK